MREGVYLEEYGDIDEDILEEQDYCRDRAYWKAAIKVLGELIIENGK